MNHCNTCKHLDDDRCSRITQWKPGDSNHAVLSVIGAEGSRAELLVNHCAFGCTMYEQGMPPTPWRVHQTITTGVHEVRASDRETTLLASIARSPNSANIARLMAAAPRMRDALQMILKWWNESAPMRPDNDDMPTDVFDAMILALTEATGMEP